MGLANLREALPVGVGWRKSYTLGRASYTLGARKQGPTIEAERVAYSLEQFKGWVLVGARWPGIDVHQRSLAHQRNLARERQKLQGGTQWCHAVKARVVRMLHVFTSKQGPEFKVICRALILMKLCFLPVHTSRVNVEEPQSQALLVLVWRNSNLKLARC